MPDIVEYTERLTHKYVDDYSNLDAWGSERFHFKILGGKQIDEGNGFDDMGSTRHRVIGSKKADQDLQAKVLRQNLSHHGCSHTYDCCGCFSFSARVKKVKPGIFSVLIHSSRNY